MCIRDRNWDPHTDVYSRNEINMIDNEGNMIEEKHRTRILLAEVPVDASLNNECLISELEATSTDNSFEDRPPLTLAHELSSLMTERNIDAQFMASIGIGATHPCLVKHPLDDDTDTTEEMTSDDNTTDSESSDDSSDESSGDLEDSSEASSEDMILKLSLIHI